MNFESVLFRDERRQETYRSSASHQQGARLPKSALADCADLLQALTTTVVGSSRTPISPRELSTFTAYSDSIRQRSDMNPSICLIPRSVY